MTTSISCRSDLTSDHNKGSANIKSDVVSTESSGSSTDVTVTTLVGGPVLSLINKRLRNQCKKFNRILHMEELLAQGKPLNKDQAQLLRSKPAIFALIDELEKLRNLLASTVSEEISLALQCHAISGKNDTSQDQDQDQEKASEEKESKAHKELPIDSRSGHKEESTKIKSDVLVSVVSQRFSSDVADTTLVGGPVLSLINKHLQNHCEKLNQILQVEEFLAQGKPLSTEQAQLLQSKSAVSAFIDELEKLRKPLASAVSEEISLALQCHAISGKSGTCQNQDQEKASEEKESKSCKELPIDPKSDHDGSTKDVMSTECSGPSQVDQQNEGNALPSRTGLKQKDRKWKIWCKNYLEENSRLLCDKMMLELEFESLKLSSVVYQLHASLIDHWPTFNGDSYMDLKEEDLEEENSLVDQQNEEFSLSPCEAERLGISINDNMEEVDWKKWCWILRGSNMWLMEMLKVYQDALDLMKKVIREFPDHVGGKPADTSELWNLS